MATLVLQECLQELSMTKFVERKILAAQLCGALPVDSVVAVGVVQFLATCAEEQNSTLRMMACSSMCMVVQVVDIDAPVRSAFNDTPTQMSSVYHVMRDALVQFSNDTSESVTQLAMKVLAPVYVDCLRRRGTLF